MSIEADSRIAIADMAAQLQPSDGWKEPVMFGLSERITQPMVAEAARQSGAGIIDEIDVVFDSLFKLRHPDKMHDVDAKAAFMHEQEARRDTYGTSVYFPWLHKVVRYPSEEDYYALRTTRNRDVITEEEHAVLRQSTILLAGLSVGSNVASALVRGGIGNKYILVESDTIEPANLNRIEADMTNVGTRKLDWLAMRISMLDPFAEQVHFREPVSASNAEEIFTHKPDVVLDEVDDLGAKALLRLYAKWHRLPLGMGTDVGKKSLVDFEHYGTDTRTVPFGGRITPAQFTALLDGSMPAEEQRKLMLKIVGVRNVTASMLRSAARIGRTISGMPQPGTTAAITGNLVADSVRDVLLGKSLKTGRSAYPNRPRGSRSESPLAFLRALREFMQADKQAAHTN